MSSYAQKPGAHRVYFNDLQDTTAVAVDATLRDENSLYVLSLEWAGSEKSTGSFYVSNFNAQGDEGRPSSVKITPFPEESGYRIVDADISWIMETKDVHVVFVIENEGIYQTYLTQLDEDLQESTTAALELSTVATDETTVADIAQTGSSSLLLIEDNKGTFSLAQVNDNFNPLWTSNYSLNGLSTKATHLSAQGDSSIIVSGVTDGGNGIFYTKIDGTGAITESKGYTSFSGVSDVKAVKNNDEEIFIAGNEQDHIVVMIADTIGDLRWSKSLDINGAATYMEDMILLSPTEIVIGGVYNNAGTLQHFSMVIDSSGSIMQTLTYQNDETGSDIDYTAVLNDPQNSGYILVGNGLLKQDTTLKVIWHKNKGEIICSETVEIDMTNDITPDVDTLSFIAAAATPAFTEVEDTLINYNPFIIPQLSIKVENTLFCPGEDINELLEASVSVVPEEFVMYEWSTGEKTDTIRGTEVDVPYTVEATVAYEECYVLYDTIVLMEYSMPQLSLNVVPTSNCTFNINSIVSGGKPPYDYNWSTGVKNNSIAVEQGSYSLDITDGCNQSASAQISVSDLELGVNILQSSDDPCVSRTLTPQLTGGVDAGLIFNWIFNGDVISNDRIIQVQEEGTYTLEIEDTNCDNTISATSVVSFDGCENPSTECFEFPNVFFPTANSDSAPEDRTFGAVIVPDRCTEDEINLESYELKVFNRWSQEVFSTTDFTEQWDGKFKGENAPSEVYVFYAVYKYAGEDEKIAKGDVTLIR